MRIPYRVAIVSIAAGVLFCAGADAGPPAPLQKDAWSKPVNKLAGRLRIAKATITTDEYFQLALEVSNRSNTPLAIQGYNPHIFSIRVIDTAGKQVKPNSTRADVISSPQWKVLQGGSSLSFPVSIQSRDGARGSHLDITTFVWKLTPGKYRISGQFSSGDAADFMGKPGKAKIWEGKLELPPVDIEVVKKK